MLFSHKKKNKKTSDPKMTLNATRTKVPNIGSSTVRKSQMSLRFPLGPLVFQITEGLAFPGTMVNLNVSKKERHVKIGDSKFQTSSTLFGEDQWGKIQEKCVI